MFIQQDETSTQPGSSGRAGAWLLSCPVCRLPNVVPINHRDEAEHLATTHDVLHHGGRPTMLIRRRGLRGLLHRRLRPYRP